MYACMYSLPKAEKRDSGRGSYDDDDFEEENKRHGTKALGGYGS
jgi:hypothetical protein